MQPYTSLRDRCNACMIHGGEEEPCLPPHYPEMQQEEETGYPCPWREQMQPDYPVVARLVHLGARTETAQLFRLAFDVEFGGDSTAERRRILGLVLRAYGDETVRANLWPQS